MKTVKRIVAVLLAVMLMAPAAVNAASPSEHKTNINKAKVTTVTAKYTGKSQAPETIKVGGKKLRLGIDFTISGYKKNVGSYTLTIKGIGKYQGTTKVTFKITKANQKVKVVTKNTISYKASALKKAKKTVNLGTTAKTKVTYTVTGKNAKKYISVNKNGKVTIKKGIKKGTYKIVIKAKGTKNYNKAQKTVKIVIKK